MTRDRSEDPPSLLRLLDVIARAACVAGVESGYSEAYRDDRQVGELRDLALELYGGVSHFPAPWALEGAIAISTMVGEPDPAGDVAHAILSDARAAIGKLDAAWRCIGTWEAQPELEVSDWRRRFADAQRALEEHHGHPLFGERP